MALGELRHPRGPAPLCRGRSTHQGLKGCVLHEVIVQVAVGHHSVYLDTVGKRDTVRRNHRQAQFQEGCWATIFTASLVAGKDQNGSFIRKCLIQWEPWDGARHQTHLDLHWGAVPLEMAFGVY